MNFILRLNYQTKMKKKINFIIYKKMLENKTYMLGLKVFENNKKRKIISNRMKLKVEGR